MNWPSTTAIRPKTSAVLVRRAKKKAYADLRGPSWRSLAVQGAHQHAEIEAGDLDQVAQ